MSAISIILPARNARAWTERALMSVVFSVNQLQWRDKVQFVLLDDDSATDSGVLDAFKKFREQSKLPAKIVHFKQRQHYSCVFSSGLSLADGDKVFFLSNDMVFTPDFFRTLVEVSDLDKTIGIVRGTSNYTDSHPEHRLPPPFPMRSFQDVLLFSNYIAQYWKQEYAKDRVLSGDAVLVNRALIDSIGVIDTRFFGYFGDIDYGIRAQRAGFQLVCAKGAWLLHEGAGYVKEEGARTKGDPATLHSQRMQVVQNAYTLFREKWDPALTPRYTDLRSNAFPELLSIQPPDLHKFIPPWKPTEEQAEIL